MQQLRVLAIFHRSFFKCVSTYVDKGGGRLFKILDIDALYCSCNRCNSSLKRGTTETFTNLSDQCKMSRKRLTITKVRVVVRVSKTLFEFF